MSLTTRFKNRGLGSLSHRLMLFSFLFTYALLIGSWTLLFISLTSGLKREDEAILKDRVKTLTNIIEREHGPGERLKQRVLTEWHSRDFERVFVRIFDSHGAIVVESPDLSTQPEVLSLFNEISTRQRNLATRTNRGDSIYQASVNDVRAANANYVVEVALDRSQEQNLLQRLRLSFTLLLLIGGLGSLWLGRTIVRIALKPVREISALAARMNSERLSERIDPLTLPLEFREVASTMNAMLDRLSENFERLAQFSEDMAHELRTPVNNLLGSMQVALTRERSTDEYRNLIGSGIEECDRLKRIIESLLFIARTSDPNQSVAKQKLKLRFELTEIVSFYQISAEERNIALELDCASDIEILAERIHLQRGVGNLLSNSIRHSPEGATIRLKVEARPDALYVRVEDQGCGIPRSALNRLGERFFRVEASRSKIYGGTGLGLSIVKTIMEIHGGHLQVESHEGRGTTVSLAFPTA